ncbi:MAG TPA: ribosome silencing factor [Chthoniobacterales bacterium]|nr:ribosome silencing factor [Chthoniobacterales bacterium]
MKKTLSTSPLPSPVDTEEQLALCCVDAALDKKAEDPVILDLRGISSFTDFFVVLTGTSEPQIKAIAGSIRDRMRKEHGLHPLSDDAYPGSQWIVVDYGSVVVHVFHNTLRGVYDLESLWGDARRVTTND